MSANYEWQKQQVQDQIAARMQEAERHRLTKVAQTVRPGFVPRLSVLLNSFRPVLMRLWRRGAHAAAKSDETVARKQLV